jgi:hypothetical protein
MLSMKRSAVILLALTGLAIAPLQTASAEGFGSGRGGRGMGVGIGIGGYSDIFGYAELYRELSKNLPYFALHPPVYYSQPVPRTYGYSPFAYPGYVMTPEVAMPSQPLEITNPYVPAEKTKLESAPASDRGAKIVPVPQPVAKIVPVPQPQWIINPYVGQTVAQNAR